MLYFALLFQFFFYNNILTEIFLNESLSIQIQSENLFWYPVLL